MENKSYKSLLRSMKFTVDLILDEKTEDELTSLGI